MVDLKRFRVMSTLSIDIAEGLRLSMQQQRYEDLLAELTR